MVGNRGAIFYWNGTEWQEQAAPTTDSLHTVVALNSQNVWAAGDGDIVHWDGNTWTGYPIPTSLPDYWVIDMSFASETNGWAVVQEYDDSTANIVYYFLHWDGAAWSRDMVIDRLIAVHMLSENEGWAADELGGVYHWDGASWQTADETMFAEGVYSLANHIFFPTADEGWAVSSSDGAVYWDGEKWQAYEALSPTTFEVIDTAVTNGQAWLIGSDGNLNYLLYWDGQSWSSITAPPEGIIRGLSVVNENDIWAVGHDLFQDYPLIWHWDGTAWSSLHSVPFPPPLNDFAMVGENEAWGVGDNGYILYWDGQQWNDFTGPTANNLNGVDFIAPDNGWAVGDNATILHWDGATWTVIKESGEEPYYTLELQDVAFVSATEIWMAGGVNSESGGGPLFVHLQWDGQTWQELDPITPYCECYFYGITMLSATDGWAVGGGYEATTVHWDGAAWQIVPNPGNYWFYSVVALMPDAVWANGIQHDRDENPGITIQWDGQAWAEVTSPVPPEPLPPLPTSEEWLKGKWFLGNSYYWNGLSWIPIHNLTTRAMIGGDMTPSGQAVVLTNSGVWLRPNE
jgi:hypothetical protein